MSIACIGAGPAGLYFSILARLQDPWRPVTVFERAPEGMTYGWGVVFWDDLLDRLEEQDPESAGEIRRRAFRWNDLIVHIDGAAPVRTPGHGYSIERATMQAILAARARALGVDLRYEHPVNDPRELAVGHELVVACDGANSRVRGIIGFDTRSRTGRNKYLWLGTSKVFRSFTFPVVRTPSGWIWAHAYGFSPEGSTFVVETTPETWAGLGFDGLTPDETMRHLEATFADHLDGHELRPPPGTSDVVQWLAFETIAHQRWHRGNVALVGDAAHTTHFTIGSGTRLAMEDAIELAWELRGYGRLEDALEAYGTRRTAELRGAQRDADNSASWFEALPRWVQLEPQTFSALLHARRSPLTRRAPRAYLWLLAAGRRAPGLARLARRVLRPLRGWRRSA